MGLENGTSSNLAMECFRPQPILAHQVLTKARLEGLHALRCRRFRDGLLRNVVPCRNEGVGIVDGNASGWLTVLPLKQEGYDMSAVQFRD